MKPELILASKSPFRAQILKNAGVTAEICGADIDERAVEADFSADWAAKHKIEAGKMQSGKTGASDFPSLLAQKLAEAKALEVSARRRDAYIIGCDQVLELEGQILHKANNEAEAVERLSLLSGKTHKLHSAFSIARGSETLRNYVGEARMTMRSLSSQLIRDYLKIAGDIVLKSVGVYQIEGAGLRLFDAIDGDYWTIIGLPIIPLLKNLRELGVTEY